VEVTAVPTTAFEAAGVSHLCMVCLTFLSLSNAVLDALPPWFGEANEGAHTIVVDGNLVHTLV
jgi:hypothetical protein